MTMVRYQFTSTGAGDVEAAFRGVTASAIRMDKAMRATGTTSATASRTAVTGASARERAEEKWAGSAVRAADKAAAATIRANDRRWRDIERTGKRIEQELAREARVAEKHAAAMARANDKISAARMRGLGRMGERAGGAVTSAVTGGLAAAGIVGGAAVRRSIMVADKARRVSINAGLAGQTVDPKQLQRDIENAALSNPGVSSDSLADAALAFQSKTGSVLSRGELGTLAKASSAFEADPADLAQLAAAAKKKFGLEGAGLEQALAVAGKLGAGGSFELKDMAGLADRLTAAAGGAGIGKGPEAFTKLMGLSQVAREGTGSSEMATTAVEGLFRKLQEGGVQSKLKSAGVDVYDKSGKLNDVFSVLTQTVAKVGGTDMVKKRSALGSMLDAEAMRAVNPMLQAFADATAEGKDGAQALSDMLTKAANASGAVAAMNQAAASAQQSATATISAAFESLTSQVGESLAPAIVDLLPHLGGLADHAAPVVGALADLAGGIDAVLDVLSDLPGFEKSPAAKQRAKARELAALDAEIAKSGVGTPTIEQLDERSRLLYETEALKTTGDTNRAPRSGAAMGAAAGSLFGPLGALFGAGAGYLGGVAAPGQAQDRSALTTSGYIETASGSIMPMPSSFLQPPASGAQGGASPGTPEAPKLDTSKVDMALSRTADVAARAAAAMEKIAESQRADGDTGG